ncbi:Protein of unknown function DUF506, plant protein [Actinidia chinensis var. chinensis]|uniref:Uncharacterized protein n=1 Tax=Actinidia chinensis var. chinensis TaxID=1590841 RepID=A0A2R6QC60_ACTCC|nr:Protein of unknown function DUF506, plant protein [Actinidia chinensis var. chinensis]
MAGATAKIPMQCQISDRPESLSLLIFEFLEEGDKSLKNLYNSSENSDYDSINNMNVDGDSNDGDANVNVEEDKGFWELKDQLLRATLIRSSSIETQIRRATKEAVTELKLAGVGCGCRRPVAVEGCRNCLLREISNRLQLAGYNCAICKSKWRSSPDIPSGEHTYLEVVDNSNPKRGEVRVVIELNFRAEFEMARANEEYNRLITQLPEVFVGKADRLRVLIKILCSAAKKCMRDKKMHMGPWRKHKYMQAKWFGTRERMPSTVIWPAELSGQLPKPRASMLTFDLVENLPVLHCTVVQVV